MKYFASLFDSNGYIYSIDNCIFDYALRYDSLKDDLIVFLYDLQKRHNFNDEFWTRLNLSPCSKWYWCSDIVHLCNGVYLSIGRYNYVKNSDTPVYVPAVKLEVNLNKHSDKEVLSDLLQWLKDYCISCYLVKYDLAVDIPTKIDNVQIFGSRQEKGLYKGTRYYGQRNKHGYTKIYDKGKEQRIDSDLTRVETTIVYNKGFRFNKIYVKDDQIKSDIKVTPTENCIVNMVYTLDSLGEDSEQYLNLLDWRAKKKILEIINGSGYKVIDIDTGIVSDLLEKVREKVSFQDLPKYYYEDVNGFLHVDDNYNLPFDD